jgi:hypothetical protein
VDQQRLEVLEVYEENYDNQPTLVLLCRPSCVLQWRIPISGDPISSFFCVLQEFAIDHLTLRLVVIFFPIPYFYQYL